MDAIAITITTYNEDGTVAEVTESTATVINTPEELAALFAKMEVHKAIDSCTSCTAGGLCEAHRTMECKRLAGVN